MKGRATTTAVDPEWIVYTGPHAEIRIVNVPVVGEVILRRDEPLQVPEEAAAVLIKNKKVSPAKAPVPPAVPEPPATKPDDTTE